MSDIYEALRWVNLALASLGLIALVWRWRAWLRLSRRMRFYGVALFGAVAVSLLGTIETLALGHPGGVRVPATTAFLAYLTIASLLPSRARTVDDTHGKAAHP